MEKKFTVPSSFIIEGYADACSGWKSRLEEKFPSLFVKTGQTTYKFGTIFELYGENYILANLGTSIGAALINTKSGNRWNEPVVTPSSKYVTLEDLQRLIPNRDIFGNFSITVAGSTLVQDSTAKIPSEVEVEEAFIHKAYDAAEETWKQKLRDQFPQVFTKYVGLLKPEGGELRLSTSNTYIDNSKVITYIGLGNAPRTELRNNCIMFENSDRDNVDLELETGKDRHGRLWVAVKRVPKK